MTDAIRVLLLADTHLGFDLPRRPRVERRRRGDDFHANYLRALAPAAAGEVDLVVHGGDLLFRSKVWPGLVGAAFEPLFDLADAGLPVFVVPGNHERSQIPYPLLARHAGVHLFDTARSFGVEVRGVRVVLDGFPCVRAGIRESFGAQLARFARPGGGDAVRLLCLHQTVAGATVGPVGYTFRGGADVIPGPAIPAGYAAVLAGHIHRAQRLERDPAGRALATPVIYPGSIERTSFAERDEPKGYYRLTIAPDHLCGGRLIDARFVELPTRPMVDLVLEARDAAPAQLERLVGERLTTIDPEAVVRLKLSGAGAARALRHLTAARLRAIAPRTMNVELSRPSAGPRRVPWQPD